MRVLLTLLALSLAFVCAEAAPPGVEELEFEYLPSFHTGLRVYVARTSQGKVFCLAHQLPIRVADGVAEHRKSGAMIAENVPVTTGDFDQLVRDLESPRLRREAESYDRMGNDGVTFRFYRRIGARSLEYSFWCPDRGSAAQGLADRFIATAKITAPWNESKPANKSIETTRGK